MKYTMINGTRDGQFELLCYVGNNVVHEQIFENENDAHKAADMWLNDKLVITNG